jgi:hypothetical protein
MLVAIRIWTKLKRSIPPAFRIYYSLVPDPTAGKVTVVARMPTLEILGLWSTSPPNPRPTSPPSKKQGPYSQLHASLLAMGMPLAAPSTAMMARNAMQNNSESRPSNLRIPRHHLLGRNWMTVADYCGLDLKKPHYGESENDDDLGDEQAARFIVESYLKTNYRTPLKMRWAQFVWLALALGVSAHDPGWQKGHARTLKNNDDEDLVHLSLEDHQLFARFLPRAKLTYSLRRAFGWYNIEFDGERLLPLGYGEDARVLLQHAAMSQNCRRVALEWIWVRRGVAISSAAKSLRIATTHLRQHFVGCCTGAARNKTTLNYCRSVKIYWSISSEYFAIFGF